MYMTVKSYYHNESVDRVGFGIAVTEEVDGEIIILETIADISDDRHVVDQLVTLCNKLLLDPCQLQNVVEDYLACV